MLRPALAIIQAQAPKPAPKSQPQVQSQAQAGSKSPAGAVPKIVVPAPALAKAPAPVPAPVPGPSEIVIDPEDLPRRLWQMELMSRHLLFVPKYVDVCVPHVPICMPRRGQDRKGQVGMGLLPMRMDNCVVSN